MPKVRPFEMEQKRRIVRASVASKKELNGWDDNQMAAKCRVSISTIKRRLERPEDFTLAELWNMGMTVYIYDGQSRLPTEDGSVKLIGQ